MTRKTDQAGTGKPGAADADSKGNGERKPGINVWVGAGIGAGIGSAAIAAALLYANRAKKDAPPRGPKDDGE